MVLRVKRQDGRGVIELHLPAEREARIREVITTAKAVGYKAKLKENAWRQNYHPRYAVQLTIPSISGTTLLRLEEFYTFYTPTKVDNPIDDATSFLNRITSFKAETPTEQHHLIGPALMINFYINNIYSRQENIYLARFTMYKQVIDPLIDHIREHQPPFQEMHDRYDTLLQLLQNGIQPSLALETYPELHP